MLPNSLKAARVTGATLGSELPARISELEAALADLKGILLDTSYPSVIHGWNLLERQTISNAAAVFFTDKLTAAYNEYVVTLTDILAQTPGANLFLRAIKNSTTVIAGGTDYTHTRYEQGFSGDNQTGDDADSQMIILASVGSNAVSGEVKLWGPANPGTNKNFMWDTIHINSVNTLVRTAGGGAVSAVHDAIDGLQFSMSSGNIVSGELALYGLRKQ